MLAPRADGGEEEAIRTLLEVGRTTHLVAFYAIAALERQNADEIHSSPVRETIEAATGERWERYRVHNSMSALVEQGLVEKCPTDDSRTFRWVLTDEGWEFLEASSAIEFVDQLADVVQEADR